MDVYWQAEALGAFSQECGLQSAGAVRSPDSPVRCLVGIAQLSGVPRVGLVCDVSRFWTAVPLCQLQLAGWVMACRWASHLTRLHRFH